MLDADVVISGAGTLSARGAELAPHAAALHGGDAVPWGGSLEGFRSERFVSDRRMLKAISERDAIGIAALEACLRQAHFSRSAFDPERVGLYVGAQAASALDAVHYEEALRAALDASGAVDMPAFGRGCMAAKPTALLIGLPNNVLCHGSIVMDARGPNSNYTSGEISGMLAIIGAAKRLQRGRLDFAVAGGYSAPCNVLHGPLLDRIGAAGCQAGCSVRELADGGAFVALERRASARARGAGGQVRYCGGALASDALGPLQRDAEGAGIETALRRALTDAGADPEDVGVVLACPGGGGSDATLVAAASRVFAHGARPALGRLRMFGVRMEASGVLEVALAAQIKALERLSDAAQVEGAAAAGFGRDIPAGRPLVAVVAGTVMGEYACVVVGV
jgi:3-oxoacyl-[acyl-carrier-protein] synthase II